MRLRDFQQDFNRNLPIKSKISLARVFGAVGEIVDAIQSRKTRALLNSALEFVKPHHLALGLRIARLSTTHVEVVVPVLAKTKTETGELDPGVLTSAALMSVELLMRRTDLSDLGDLELGQIQFSRLAALKQEVRGRLELPKLAQEALRVDLRKQGRADLELQMIFFDEDDRRVADCQMNYQCKFVQKLDWKDQDGRS